MGFLDYLLLGGIALWACFSIVWARRQHKKGGCCGSCQGCDRCCHPCQ